MQRNADISPSLLKP